MIIRKTLTLSEMLPTKRRFGRSRPDDLFSVASPREQSRYECIWMSADDAQGVPSVVVAQGNEMEKLFADVATYYPGRTPITAYSYVVKPEVAESVVKALTRPSWPEHARDDRQANIWLGMILGETLTGAYIAGGDEDAVSFSVCRRSLSFGLARYAYLYGVGDPQTIWTNWSDLRALVGSESSETLLQSIALVAETMLSKRSSVGKKGDAREVNLARLFSDSYVPNELENAFDNIYPGLSLERTGLAEHFDARVPAFERVASKISEARRGSEIDAMAVAFFANLIAPGSLAHTRLVAKRLQTFPTALLWYCMFAAMADEFDPQGVFYGIGSKLNRDIETEFRLSMRPSADVALDEMKILSRIGLRSRVVKPIHPRSLLVSLFPGVDVYVRYTDSQDASHQDADAIERRAQQIAQRDAHIRRMLQDAQRLLEGGLDGGQLNPWLYTKRGRKPRERI